MEAARHLHIVDADTGERLDGCPSCAIKEDHVAGLQRDIRGWAARYAELRRDKEAEAEAHKLWPAAREVFKHWQDVCNHPRSGWSADRFFLVEPFLEKHGADLCKRAVDGYAFDCFVTKRRNGTKRRHDGWELIFGDVGHFEEGVNKAPRVAA